MATRETIRDEIQRRLRDTTNAVWSVTDLNGFIDNAIKALYPYWYQRNTATTTAGAGPLQTMPSGARNLYAVGHQRAGSTRVRELRGWREGDGVALVPRTGIAGDTLVWSWTSGYDAPPDDTTTLTVPLDAEEVVIIRAQISALEAIVADRVSQERYLALAVREGSTDADVLGSLDALHASLSEHLQRAVPLPEVRR